MSRVINLLCIWNFYRNTNIVRLSWQWKPIRNTNKQAVCVTFTKWSTHCPSASPPPFLKHRYGKRQTFPRPMISPAMESRNSILLAHFSLDWTCSSGASLSVPEFLSDSSLVVSAVIMSQSVPKSDSPPEIGCCLQERIQPVKDIWPSLSTATTKTAHYMDPHGYSHDKSL